MNKVFVVAKVENETEEIVGIFSTMKKAKDAKKAFERDGPSRFAIHEIVVDLPFMGV